MFDEYLSGLSAEHRSALADVIDHVAALVPEATEGRSYGLNAFRYRDKPLLGFAVHKDHLGLYPFSATVLESAKPLLADFSLSKGTIRFAPDHPLPREVITQLVTARKVEIDAH